MADHPGHEGPCANSWKLFVLFGERIADPQGTGALVENPGKISKRLWDGTNAEWSDIKMFFSFCRSLLHYLTWTKSDSADRGWRATGGEEEILHLLEEWLLCWPCMDDAWCMWYPLLLPNQTMFSMFFGLQWSGVWSWRMRCWELVV